MLFGTLSDGLLPPGCMISYTEHPRTTYVCKYVFVHLLLHLI